MSAILLVVLVAVGLALVVVGLLVLRRLWQIMGSVECLCTNVGRLAERISHGEHAHDG
jgi:hypothetical protein